MVTTSWTYSTWNIRLVWVWGSFHNWNMCIQSTLARVHIKQSISNVVCWDFIFIVGSYFRFHGGRGTLNPGVLYYLMAAPIQHIPRRAGDRVGMKKGPSTSFLLANHSGTVLNWVQGISIVHFVHLLNLQKNGLNRLTWLPAHGPLACTLNNHTYNLVSLDVCKYVLLISLLLLKLFNVFIYLIECRNEIQLPDLQ